MADELPPLQKMVRRESGVRTAEGCLSSAAFSPDGRRVLTSSGDGTRDTTARLWSADGQGEPLVFKGHADAVWSAAFSPDGRRVVTASADGTARVWSADGQGEPLVLKSDGRSAAFSPDGRRVVTSSETGAVRVWRVDWTDLLDDLDRRTTACLSAAQRIQYLGETAQEAKTRFDTCERRFQRVP